MTIATLIPLDARAQAADEANRRRLLPVLRSDSSAATLNRWLEARSLQPAKDRASAWVLIAEHLWGL